MQEAKCKDLWGHTSNLMALIANVNRDPKKGRACRPADFNPYTAKGSKGTRITADNIGELKVMVPPKKKKKEKA